MRNVYLTLKRSVVFVLLLCCQFAIAHPVDRGQMAADTLHPDTIPPVIKSFTPTSGRKGTVVTIIGSHFSFATAARFGGVLADSIIIYSDTVIKAIVDTGATGSVSVTTPNGTASKPGFTYIIDTTQIPDSARPHIYSFSPTSARRGTEVTIVGNNLRYASAVLFGGVNAASYIVYGDTIVKAKVGAGASGNV